MTNRKNTKQAEKMNDTIEGIMGKHRGYRRAHARGHVYEALFTPTKTGAFCSSSAIFHHPHVRAVVRFSHSSPDPTMADSLSPIKGMAVKLLPPDASEVNLVTATVSLFVAKEPEAFLEMMQIGRKMKKGRPRLSDMVKLIRKYPESMTALRLYRKIQAPSSFAVGTYYSIHAFYLVTSDGYKRPVKFIWKPAEVSKSSDKQHKTLEEELDDRLKNEKIQFNLYAQLGEEKDPTDDPTVEWPKEREMVNMGCLSLRERILKDEEDLLFDPTVTGEGIEGSEDKILKFRSDVYSVSHSRRKKQE